MARTVQPKHIVNQREFDEKFVRPAFHNIRPDWESGPDMIRYTLGVDSISGGRPGEVPLFKAVYEWAAHRCESFNAAPAAVAPRRAPRIGKPHRPQRGM